MSAIRIDDPSTRYGYRIVSSLASDTKSICHECGYITADDPDLAYIKMLSFEESQVLSARHGVRIISRYYCGDSGFE